jgi:hypothetical protein
MPDPCNCTLWTTRPEVLRDQGVPRGYCGLCDRCGKPGHTRHFPGAAPFTSCWCDAHYRRAKWLHPLGARGSLLWAALVLVCLAGLLWVAR